LTGELQPESVTTPHFAAVRHLARRRIEDEVIVLDLHRSRIYGMNPSAGAVLEALQRPQTVPQIAAHITPAGTAESTVCGELERFVAELAALGLIARCPTVAEAEATAPAPAIAAAWTPPALLWQEEVARVTNQISPPQQIGNPACLP